MPISGVVICIAVHHAARTEVHDAVGRFTCVLRGCHVVFDQFISQAQRTIRRARTSSASIFAQLLFSTRQIDRFHVIPLSSHIELKPPCRQSPLLRADLLIYRNHAHQHVLDLAAWCFLHVEPQSFDFGLPRRERHSLLEVGNHTSNHLREHSGSHNGQPGKHAPNHQRPKCGPACSRIPYLVNRVPYRCNPLAVVVGIIRHAGRCIGKSADSPQRVHTSKRGMMETKSCGFARFNSNRSLRSCSHLAVVSIAFRADSKY